MKWFLVYWLYKRQFMNLQFYGLYLYNLFLKSSQIFNRVKGTALLKILSLHYSATQKDFRNVLIFSSPFYIIFTSKKWIPRFFLKHNSLWFILLQRKVNICGCRCRFFDIGLGYNNILLVMCIGKIERLWVQAKILIRFHTTKIWLWYFTYGHPWPFFSQSVSNGSSV